MAILTGSADLPLNALVKFGRPPHATACSRGNVLYELADYIRSATLSNVANDTANTAWGMLAPLWFQRQQRIRKLERMMKEVQNSFCYTS